MKVWPVPNSRSRNVPKTGDEGSFWEKRGDKRYPRYHCGVDIYAPKGSSVFSVENGTVIETDKFTFPDEQFYWKETFYVVIKNNSGLFCKYAELGCVKVKHGEVVEAGHIIGCVGEVLDSKKINKNAPHYIRLIHQKNNRSMLHFEFWDEHPVSDKRYLGGNWFGEDMPKHLVDPTAYLEEAVLS